MSAKRGKPKRPQEDYETPAWCVQSLLSEVQLPGGCWLDPCAGSGSIIRAVNEVRSDVAWSGCEIRSACTDSLRSLAGHYQIGDFFDPVNQKLLRKSLPGGRFSVVLTNPPYSVAEDFINACLPLADATIMLLRLNFLETAPRAAFWRQRMANVYVLPNRPSFTGGGTDATAYAWFLWTGHEPREFGVIRVLAPVPRAIRKKA